MDLQKNSTLPQMSFIVGMGRSGTTLLTNMLNSHPAIVSTPENEFVLFMNKSFLNNDFSKIGNIDYFFKVFGYDFNSAPSFWTPNKENSYKDIESLKINHFSDVCKIAYLNYPFNIKEKSSIRYIVDKNPVYSIFMEDIDALFPNSKYIVIVRDYRDNILSRQTKIDSKREIYQLAASWNFYYDIIFKKINKKKLLHQVVRYEDIVSYPEETLKKICTLLEGVDYSDQMLNFQKVSKDIKQYIKDNSSEEVYNEVSKKHANLEKPTDTQQIGKYKTALNGEYISILNSLCQEYGAKFDYEEIEEKVNIGLFWKFYYQFSYLKIRLYYKLKTVYYQLPISLRLLFISKRKSK